MGNIDTMTESFNFWYIENNTKINEEDKKTLEEISSKLEIKDNINPYFDNLKNSEILPELLIIDAEERWLLSLKIIERIRKIRPSQVIMLVNNDYNKMQLMQILRHKVSLCFQKPFSIKERKDLPKLLLEECTKIDVLKTVKDDDKQKVLENALYKLECDKENKDNFFANMSHEIRTPINAVIGLSHIMLDSDIKKEHVDYIEKIKLSGTHILNIVNDILDYSKMEAGKFSVETIEYNINSVLENASTMIAFKAFEKGLNLVFEADNRIPAFLLGDPLRLSQIIINLLNNAVKFTKKGQVGLGVKLLKSQNNKQLLEFTISDTGIGLSSSQMNGLFNSYAQADSSTARQFGGTGLGLSISKQLVELMGGEIRIESIQGEGSNFIFTIETEFADKESYFLPTEDMKNKRVAIVESNPKVQQSLAHMLQRYHYETVMITDHKDLQSEMTNNPFDILFIDKAILGEFKTEDIEKNCQAKVVILHPSLEMCTRDNFQGMSIDSRLVKPFTPERVHLSLFDIFDVEPTLQVSDRKNISKKDLKSLEDSHILLVEDNKINQSIVLALLDETGIKVTVANDGQEVVEMFDDLGSIDLILMDIEMPFMNGYETMKFLQDNKNIDNIPVVALTGNSRQKDLEQIKEAGMVSHLSKPMDVNAFYNALLKHISEKHSFVERAKEGADEILALIGVGKHAQALALTRRLKKDKNIQNYPIIERKLIEIDNNILQYKNLFLVMVKNYNKRFKDFLDTSMDYLEAKTLNQTQIVQILSINKGIATLKSEDKYRESLEQFVNKYRDSVEALSKRAEELRLEEAIQLSYQIKREAIAIEALFVSQSLEPIIAVEQSQRQILDNRVGQLKSIVLKTEEV